MRQVLVIGAGKIGSLIALLLAESQDYYVYLADIKVHIRPDLVRLVRASQNIELIELDATDSFALSEFLKQHPLSAIIASLPYYKNLPVAAAAKEFNLPYFDLTEDRQTTGAINQLAEGASSAFIPQCGLAPGFISIVANDLMQHFTELDTVKLRVGALPINSSNALQYSLTWSTEGLINQYGNPCRSIINGKEIDLLPLDDLEEIEIDGLTYEAFNTSGGLGHLAESYRNRVNYLNYKTIRYPGHCAKMRFLMNDLKLNQARETLKHILENALPRTLQDVVLVYVSVSGTQDHQFVEENYVRKFYPKTLLDITWSAIQMTTASSICAVIDIVLNQPEQYKGFIPQERFSLTDFLQNRFGLYFT